jgi:hypothetical protein
MRPRRDEHGVILRQRKHTTVPRNGRNDHRVGIGRRWRNDFSACLERDDGRHSVEAQFIAIAVHGAEHHGKCRIRARRHCHRQRIVDRQTHTA